MNLLSEFERQVQNLLDKGYPKDILEYTDELKKEVETLSFSPVDLEKGYLPFVIVVKSELLSTEEQMAKVVKDGKEGITKLYPHTSKDFSTIEKVTIPDRPVYLLIDIDRGKETINLPPNEAFNMIEENNRSPLTITEGIAIVTQYPEFLVKNNCFSLLASRHPGDQRVPAIWINGERHPNLGWCWDGNPHTWLGSASCKKRI